MFDWLKGPIVKRLLSSGVRAGLAALTGWLVAHGYASETDATALAQELLPLIVALLWSAWEQSRVQEKLESAAQGVINPPRTDTN